METRILVVGFGNIGKEFLRLANDYPQYFVRVVGIVTKRPEDVKKEIGDDDINVFDLKKMDFLNCGADVAIMCGGSKNDLPKQTPFFAKYFNVVDSFDTHAHIGPYVEEDTDQPMLGHLESVNAVCLANKRTGCVGVGWDPGSFSMMRLFFYSCLPGAGKVHAFYGLTERGGLSMGHTNAIKGIPGVADALQFTHAKPEAIEAIRRGGVGVFTKKFSDREKHWRECLVVLSPGADGEAVRRAIVNMPNYFAPYDTEVKFVSQKELNSRKDDFSHDGLVIACGSAGRMEFKNVWESNPRGTAGFLLAYANAVQRANLAGRYGCFTVLDFPVADLYSGLGKTTDFI